MPVLKNARHELYAQELAKGKDAEEAYAAAGYRPDRGNACRVKAKIQPRVDEILSKIAKRAEITQADVLRELGKIGFSDIRKLVRWSAGPTILEPDIDEEQEAQAHGGSLKRSRRVDGGLVEFVASDEIDDDTAGAISEISQSSTGAVKIKFHDKRAALVDIGKHLGMFKDSVSVPSVDLNVNMSIGDTELARLIVFQLTKAAKAAE